MIFLHPLNIKQPQNDGINPPARYPPFTPCLLSFLFRIHIFWFVVVYNY